MDVPSRHARGAGRDVDALLERSVAVHGHCCPGQVLGVRMSMAGMRAVGISEPEGVDRKKLIVFVEMDRCATDAVQSVTGCSLGKRSMKFFDYGKMAATFLNTETGRAVRVLAREESRDRARDYVRNGDDKYRLQLEAYKIMPDDELFTISEVMVDIAPEDRPGRPMARVRCEACGEYVQDRRHMRRNGRDLCRPCVGGAYYRNTM